jgi:SAM-dependent methyltransferase
MPITKDPMPPVERSSIGLLHSAFDYVREPQHGSPAPGYYWFRKRQKVLKLITDRVRPASGSWNFLEFGCGNGIDFFLIRRKLGELAGHERFTCLGLEGNPLCVEMCRAKADYYKAANVSFKTHDVLSRSPVDAASVDFVYCSEVLEHLPEPELLIREVARILKPGGQFLVTTPNEPNLLQRSYWSRKRRAAQLEGAGQEEVEGPNGQPLLLYGHISLRKISEWEVTLAEHGLILEAAERGALCYSPNGLTDREFPFAVQLFAESVLDLLPVRLSRNISDQLIGLYRKVPD